MEKKRNNLWLAALAAVLVYFLYSVSDVLGPFLFGAILAYFFHPLISKLQEYKVPRGLSAFIVLVVIIAIFVLASMVLVPKLYEQTLKFVSVLPGYTKTVRKLIETYLLGLKISLPSELLTLVKEKITQLTDYGFKQILNLFQGVLNHSASILQTISLVVIAPVVAFYLMRDWPRVLRTTEKWLPQTYRRPLYDSLNKINEALSSYIRGQALVSLCLATYYALSLSVIGLNYSIVMGAITGVLAIIPYLGFSVSLLAALLIAYVQGGGVMLYGLVLACYTVGQLTEISFLAPQLIGRKMGVHPIWVLFALFSGGYLFGFWGVLLATPLAGIIRALLPSIVQNLMRKSSTPDKNG